MLCILIDVSSSLHLIKYCDNILKYYVISAKVPVKNTSYLKNNKERENLITLFHSKIYFNLKVLIFTHFISKLKLLF